MIPGLGRDPRPRAADPENNRRFDELFEFMRRALAGIQGSLGATGRALNSLREQVNNQQQSTVTDPATGNLVTQQGGVLTVTGRRVVALPAASGDGVIEAEVQVTWGRTFGGAPVVSVAVEDDAEPTGRWNLALREVGPEGCLIHAHCDVPRESVTLHFWARGRG